MMKTKVTKLFDVDQIPTPEDLPDWHVDEAAVDGLLDSLALRHAAETEEREAQTGDTVFCAAGGKYAGRTVLVYPGRHMPGAEAAEKAVLGAAPGATVETELGGAPAVLTVKKIVRRAPAKIDDKLIQGEHIDGVDTVESYRVYIKNKTEEQNRSLSAKHLSASLREELIARSAYEVDEAEQEAWTDKAAREMLKMYEAEGIDPHVPEEGTDFLTDEEVLENFKTQLRPQFLALAVSRAFCAGRGVAFGEEERKLYADNGVTGEQAEESFMDSKMWEILYDIALKRLEEAK